MNMSHFIRKIIFVIGYRLGLEDFDEVTNTMTRTWTKFGFLIMDTWSLSALAANLSKFGR